MRKFVSLLMTLVLAMTVLFSFTGSTVSEKINPTLNISADNISYELSDTLYGLSLDDVGYAVNGGLVSELVSNNSFEYTSNAMAGWKIDGVDYAIETAECMNEKNSVYLHITADGEGTVENFGYTEIFNNKSTQYSSKKATTADMGFKEDEMYEFSAFFKNIDFVGTMSISLNAEGNTELYQFNIDNCDDWTKVSLSIKSDVTADGSLIINVNGTGNFYMDSVSLVPVTSYGYGKDSWKYVSLRQDLFDAISELSPSFIRFYEDAVSWKDTIGSLETRTQVSTEYDNGRYYVNSNAMGFYEYLVLCEDLNAVPVPVFNMDLQEYEVIEDVTEEAEEGTTVAEETTTVTEQEETEQETEEQSNSLAVQSILDFIEYATGDETTVWGAKRVADGHSKPFKLSYIALDGENDYYLETEELCQVLTEKYPDINVIISSIDDESASGTSWGKLATTYHNVLFNEYYGDGRIDLYDNVHKYDEYERSESKITVDSFNSYADGIGTIITANNIWSAIENTTFLMGLEKNSDVVTMASYENAIAKRNAQAEQTSLIWFDSQDILLTADYYSQMIFANNLGTNHISTDFDMEEDGIYQSTTVDIENKVIYVKLVNTTSREQKINISLEGFKNVNNPSVQYMTEHFKSAYNDFEEQLHVAPAQADLTVENNNIVYNIGSYSINVVRIPYDTNDGTSLYELPETDIVSPYMHPMVEYALPITLVALIFITGVIILFVRIRHHKSVREEKK